MESRHRPGRKKYASMLQGVIWKIIIDSKHWNNKSLSRLRLGRVPEPQVPWQSLQAARMGTEQDAVGPSWLLCTQISAHTLSAVLFDI